jgi:phospholipid-binding lipoprotein MlaA
MLEPSGLKRRPSMLKKHHLIMLLLILLVGCATQKPTNNDPFESYNRKMYTFNVVLDQLYLKPTATIYSKTPSPLQKGVSNFASNIKTLNSLANQILQLNPKGAVHDLGRFAINSTIGIVGLFDPATAMGLKNKRQDFGQTLARWGYHHSAYFMIPLLGPATVRDAIGRGVDMTYLSASDYLIKDKLWRNRYTALNAINQRARVLPMDKTIAAAFDPYVFVRNAYLQRRTKAISKTLGKDTYNTSSNPASDNTNNH